MNNDFINDDEIEEDNTLEEYINKEQQEEDSKNSEDKSIGRDENDNDSDKLIILFGTCTSNNLYIPFSTFKL